MFIFSDLGGPRVRWTSCYKTLICRLDLKSAVDGYINVLTWPASEGKIWQIKNNRRPDIDRCPNANLVVYIGGEYNYDNSKKEPWRPTS